MKVGVVGCGFVGSTAAYAMVMNGIGREIVMIDRDAKRAHAEADDIMHAVPFAHPLSVTAGDYSALAGSRVVIVAAGVGQKPGESRLSLLERNAAVFGDVIPQILQHAPDAVLLAATNPVDVMTHVAAGIARKHGVAESRVIGSGTTLDTARFRTLLGNHFGIDSHHVHAYVLGEHGDSEVLTWSSATVGGLNLSEFGRLQEVPLDENSKQRIDEQVRRAAYSIIEGKRATYYGIGSALSRIVDAVIHDQRGIFTICTPRADVLGIADVTVSLPSLVCGQGILRTLPVSLDDNEQSALRASASTIRKAIDSLGDL